MEASSAAGEAKRREVGGRVVPLRRQRVVMGIPRRVSVVSLMRFLRTDAVARRFRYYRAGWTDGSSKDDEEKLD